MYSVNLLIAISPEKLNVSYHVIFSNNSVNQTTFSKIAAIDSYSASENITVPEDSVLYKNLFVCFNGGGVGGSHAESYHILSLRTVSLTGTTLTVSVYYPVNYSVTPHWSADIYYSEW